MTSCLSEELRGSLNMGLVAVIGLSALGRGSIFEAYEEKTESWTSVHQ